MRITSAVSVASVVGLAGVLMVVLADPALAHEERKVGTYAFAVGFGDEPAYTGQRNSVQLLLRDGKDRPVTDLTDTLRVEVTYGTEGQTMTLPLEPFFEVGESGIPGDYRGWFFPTQPGDYTFHFVGSIKGQRVDERFTSGPQTFSPVEDPVRVQFPAKVPTAGEVAARLAREIPRLSRNVAAARTNADNRADSARLVGFLGLGLGSLGVLLGAVALAIARRRGPSGDPIRPAPTEPADGSS